MEQPSPKAGIEAVDDGEIDVLVGPISITSRRLAMPGIDFTQPYYLGKSGVLLPMRPPSILSRIQVFFGWAVISSVLVLISVLLVVGSLIWLAERNRNSEQFPRDWLPGISSGMWFALVTLTTVGYGNTFTPSTPFARHFASVFALVGLMVFGAGSAVLSASIGAFFAEAPAIFGSNARDHARGHARARAHHHVRLLTTPVAMHVRVHTTTSVC